MSEYERLTELFTEVLSGQYGNAKNTILSYLGDIHSFKLYIGQLSLKAVTNKDIIGYIRQLHDKKRSNKTICRHLSALRQFYNFLAEEQIIEINPTLHIDSPKNIKSLPKFLDHQSIFKLFEASDALPYPESLRMKLLLYFLYGSGLRVSEALDLKVGSVVFDGQYVLVSGKGGRERAVPVPEQLLVFLKEWVSQHNLTNTDWLFPSVITKKRLTRQRIFQLIKKLATSAGIDQRLVSPHVMRHAFATHLINNGADLFSVKKMLGHRSVTTTEIYTHITNDKIKAELLSNHPLSKKNLK